MAINTRGLSARNVQTIIESAINTKKLEHPSYGFLEFCLQNFGKLPFESNQLPGSYSSEMPEDEKRLLHGRWLTIFNNYRAATDRLLVNRDQSDADELMLILGGLCIWQATAVPDSKILWLIGDAAPENQMNMFMANYGAYLGAEHLTDTCPPTVEHRAIQFVFRNGTVIDVLNYSDFNWHTNRQWDLAVCEDMENWREQDMRPANFSGFLQRTNRFIGTGAREASGYNFFDQLGQGVEKFTRLEMQRVWNEDAVLDCVMKRREAFAAIGNDMSLDDVLAANDVPPLDFKDLIEPYNPAKQEIEKSDSYVLKKLYAEAQKIAGWDDMGEAERETALNEIIEREGLYAELAKERAAKKQRITDANLAAVETEMEAYMRELQATPIMDKLQAEMRELPDYENMDAKQKSGLAYDTAAKFNLTAALQQELAAIPALSPDEYAAYRVTKLWKGACQDLYVLKGVDTEKDTVFALKYRDVLAALLDMWVAGNYDLMEFFAKHIKDAEQQMDDAEPGTGFAEVVELAAIRKACRDAQREFSADWILDGKYEKSYSDFLAEWEAWGRDKQVEFLQGKGLYVLRKRAGVKRMVDELTEMQKGD